MKQLLITLRICLLAALALPLQLRAESDYMLNSLKMMQQAVIQDLHSKGVLTAQENRQIENIPFVKEGHGTYINLAYKQGQLVFLVDPDYIQLTVKQSAENGAPEKENVAAALGNAIGRAALYKKLPGPQAVELANSISNTVKAVGLAYEISTINAMLGTNYELDSYPRADPTLVDYIKYSKKKPLFIWNKTHKVYIPDNDMINKWSKDIEQYFITGQEIDAIFESKWTPKLSKHIAPPEDDENLYGTNFRILLQRHPLLGRTGYDHAIILFRALCIISLISLAMYFIGWIVRRRRMTLKPGAAATRILDAQPIIDKVEKVIPYRVIRCVVMLIIVIALWVLSSFLPISLPIGLGWIFGRRKKSESPAPKPKPQVTAGPTPILDKLELIFPYRVWRGSKFMVFLLCLWSGGIAYALQLPYVFILPVFYILTNFLPEKNEEATDAARVVSFISCLACIPLTFYALQYIAEDGNSILSSIWQEMCQCSHELDATSTLMCYTILIGIAVLTPFYIICRGCGHFINSFLPKQ